MSLDDFISMSAAARVAEVSTNWLRQLIHAGKLEAMRTPYGWVVSRAAVERLARERREQRARKALSVAAHEELRDADK
jgi:hypothetical protein